MWIETHSKTDGFLGTGGADDTTEAVASMSARAADTGGHKDFPVNDGRTDFHGMGSGLAVLGDWNPHPSTEWPEFSEQTRTLILSLILVSPTKTRFHDVKQPVMKANKATFSHAAVFAMGAALALVVRHPSARDSEQTKAAAAGHDSAGQASRHAGISADTKTTARKAQRETRGIGSVTARLGEVRRIGDPLERQAALMDLVARLGPGEFEAFAEQYRSMEHLGNTRDEFEMILRSWAKADPLAALDYTSKLPRGREQTSIVLTSWAASDPAAAAKWAVDHFQGDGPNPWMAAVIHGTAAHDVAQAWKLAAAMPKSPERNQAMDSIARALLVQGADVAMAYPASIQDPELRAAFTASIAARLTDKNPDRAANWLASMTDASAQSGAARHVGEALAKQDISKAKDWLTKLSPEAQAEAARGVLVPMSRDDITGTAKWLSTLSGIPNFDSVVKEYVWSCDYRSPEQSAAWIEGISDPEERTRLYHSMLGSWARRDYPAVKNWVANNPVPQSVSERFSK